MEFPKVYAAAKRAKGAEWALCEALADEIPKGGKTDPALKRCADELEDRGIEYSVQTLAKLRDVGLKFPAGTRVPGVTPRTAQAAGTPAVLRKAAAVAEEEGRPISQRLVERVRKATSKATKKLPPKKSKAEVAEAISKMPVSDLRRHANVSKLEGFALKAARQGREFVGYSAGFELDADERDLLAADIDRVIETWKIARSALKGGIAAEAEEFLQSLT